MVLCSIEGYEKMTNKLEIISYGLSLIERQHQAVGQLKQSIDTSFQSAIEQLSSCSGHVITAGVGKSGIIARKFAATLCSTGTPAFFLCANEAQHGDLGAIGANDLLFTISYSGQSQELVKLVEQAQSKLSLTTLAMTQSALSPLAQISDTHLTLPKVKESCHLGLAPSSSTTCSLVFCDTIAMSLSKLKALTAKDFSRNHPAGSLGVRLNKHAKDFMRTKDGIPTVSANCTLANAIIEMNNKRMGCTLIVNDNKQLIGIFSDGDLRRSLNTETELNKTQISEIMTHSPKHITPDTSIDQTLKIMHDNKITVLPCLTQEMIVCGIIHLQDITLK